MMQVRNIWCNTVIIITALVVPAMFETPRVLNHIQCYQNQLQNIPKNEQMHIMYRYIYSKTQYITNINVIVFYKTVIMYKYIKFTSDCPTQSILVGQSKWISHPVVDTQCGREELLRTEQYILIMTDHVPPLLQADPEG